MELISQPLAAGARRAGGVIPGNPPHPACSYHVPSPSQIPVLIAVPHAGRAYPDALLDAMHNPGVAVLRLEDRLADLLAEQVAAATGAAVLVAHAPRAMIDLNRAPDEVDWAMFAGDAPAASSNQPVSRRVRNGLGLIPRRLSGLGELWKARHQLDDLEARIAGVHAPYHHAIETILSTLRKRWGAALLIDLHSMPPLVQDGRDAAHYVIGDRFGAACHGRLTGAAFHYLASAAVRHAHNRPYAGGYVLERHADPAAGIHAIQLEVDRSCYLDRHLAQPGAGFDQVVATITGLVQRLANETAELGQDGFQRSWQDAAE